MNTTRILVASVSVLAAGVACAQSSVTIFGVVDTNLAIGKGSISNKTHLGNSGNSSTRLGFRGVEDLGGGMSAGFWLEMGFSSDTGEGAATNSNNQASGVGAATAGRQGLVFNRRSTVSLSSRWGELRLGRDFTPTFFNQGTYDPFGASGVATTQIPLTGLGGPVAIRSSNGIAYFLPSNLGGIFGTVQYYLGENPSNAGATKDDGTGMGMRLGYASGPANVALAYERTSYASGDIRQWNLGGQWDFGVVRAMGQYNSDRVNSVVPVNAKGFLVGGVVPVRTGEVRISYSSLRTDAGAHPRTNKLGLGYVHSLSKRTAIYGTAVRVNNSGGASFALNGAVTAPNTNSTGYDFGIRHSF